MTTTLPIHYRDTGVRALFTDELLSHLLAYADDEVQYEGDTTYSPALRIERKSRLVELGWVAGADGDHFLSAHAGRRGVAKAESLRPGDIAGAARRVRERYSRGFDERFEATRQAWLDLAAGLDRSRL